jgi:hypothetical protein
LRQVLGSEPCNSKLRSKDPNVHPAPTMRGEYIIIAGETQIVKSSTLPTGIVFIDGSFLTVYEKWSKETDSLLGYSYHYQRPDDWFVRYDMQETELIGHPKYHIQAKALGENIRLPSGEVRCEEVLKMIIEQFFSEACQLI